MRVNNNIKKTVISKKKAYSVICLFLSLTIFLTSCSLFGTSITDLVGELETTAPEETEQKDTTFRLPYSLSDTLDIYGVESRVNNDLASLCYDGLIKVNSSWDAECNLAESFEKKNATVIFKISDKAVFSDGTPVTAADCAYSFGLAQTGKRYSRFFESILSFRATGEKTFSVTFSHQAQQYINLCAVPIVKSGTGSLLGTAIGAGKYKAEKTDENIILTVNAYREEMKDAKLQKIEAVGYTTPGDMMSDFNYGGTDALYADLSDGSSKYRGGSELSAFTTNSAIILVVNPNRPFFASYKNVCKGFTVGIDRDLLYSEALRGCAVMTWVPFNPSWSRTIEANLSDSNYDKAAAERFFYDARLYKDENWQYEYYGSKVNLRIVVDSDNRNHTALAQALSAQLTEMGFSTTVRQLASESYAEAVANKNYDILIAEVDIGYDMDIRHVFDEIGYDAGQTAFSAALEAFANGTADIKTVLELFSEAMPFIPICYTRSALALNLSVKGEVEPSENFIFPKIETWSKN